MKIKAHLFLIFFLTVFLSGCGGDFTPMKWEKYFELAFDLEGIFVQHHASVVDPFEDIVSVFDVSYTAFPPNTPGGSKASKFLIIKNDQDGNVIWSHLLDYQDNAGFPRDVATDADGNLYVAGTNFLMKFNSAGEFVWQRTNEGLLKFNSITIAGQRAYLAGKETHVYNLAGDFQFSYEVEAIRDGYYDKAIVTKNGDIIRTFSSAITRHDSSGNLLWSAPAPADALFAGTAVIDEEENVYASYFLRDERRPLEILEARVLKFNSKGEQQWSMFIEDRRKVTGTIKYGSMKIYVTSTGNITNVASDKNDTQITHINKDTGKIIWEKLYPDTGVSNGSYMDSNDNITMVTEKGSTGYRSYYLDSTGTIIKTYRNRADGLEASLSVIGKNMYVISTEARYDADLKKYDYFAYMGMFTPSK